MSFLDADCGQSCPGPGRPLSQASVTTGLRTNSTTPSGFHSDSRPESRLATSETYSPLNSRYEDERIRPLSQGALWGLRRNWEMANEFSDERPESRPATRETHVVEDFLDDDLSLSPRPKSGQEVRKPWSARVNPLKIAFSSYPSHLEEQLPVIPDTHGHGPLKPASSSLHASALRSGAGRPQAEKACLIQTALEKDEKRLEYKYRAPVTSCFQPLQMDSARYHVKLPSSPQHRKYAARAHEQHSARGDTEEVSEGKRRNTLREQGTMLSSKMSVQTTTSDGQPKTRQKVAFDIQRLEAWFRLMDTNSSGEITVRKLIVGMMKHQELCDLFYILKGNVNKDGPADLQPKVGALTRDDIKWIRDVITSLDQDGNSSMDWPEFVDFFRKAGLLLTYQERDDLNMSDLGEVFIEVHRREVEKERKLQQEMFFSEQRRAAKAVVGGKRESNKDALRKKRMSRAPNAAARQSDCSQAQTT